MTSGQGGPQDIEGPVARGFEALVESEQPTVSPARPPMPAGGSVIAAAGGPPAMGGDGTRLGALEERVRQTMEALTNLVRTEIPQAVGGLRDELETLRIDLQTSLQQATVDLAQERQDLRVQIAKTVGAANKWFVKARDQLIERLDKIAAVAAEAEQSARAAQAAAPPPAPAGLAAAPVPALERPKAVELAQPDLSGDGDEVFEWDVDLERSSGGRPSRMAVPTATPATVDLAIDSAELDDLMDPVRGDIRELQAEVSAMGQAVAELRLEVAGLAKRVPLRPRPVRLDERDIDLIIEAVLVALAPPATKRAAAKRVSRT